VLGFCHAAASGRNANNGVWIVNENGLQGDSSFTGQQGVSIDSFQLVADARPGLWSDRTRNPGPR